MSKITQLKQNDEVIYPKTIFDAVLTSDGSTLSSKYDYIRRNYTKRSELINDLDVDFDPSTKSLELSLGNINLSTINTDNFAISGILDSASFNNDILTLNFTSGDSVGIDLTDIAVPENAKYARLCISAKTLKNFFHIWDVTNDNCLWPYRTESQE